MPSWFRPTPSPYRPHAAGWREPLHLHLAPLWREVARTLGTLRGSVLDVGCGTKPYRALLGPGVTEYLGLDRAVAGTDADVTGTADALPFGSDRFDAVLSLQVLEHVEDPARCVAEMARVLRPGGVVVITVPGVWPAHEEPRDFWRFTRHGLVSVARSARLEGIEVVPLGGLWSALGQMANLEIEHHAVGRALVPLVNLAARSLDRRARQDLVLNWLLRAERRW